MSLEITIVGAGISGLASGYFLAQKGARITLIDKSSAGAESSWAGGGILFPLLPWNYPEPVVSLAKAGWESYPDFSRAIHSVSGIDPEYLPCGMHLIEAERTAARKWCRENDFPFEEFPSSFFLPEVSQIRNPKLIKGLYRCLEIMGVKILENTEVSSVNKTGSEISNLTTSDGKTLTADTFLFCAGAWSKKLLGESAPNIFPVKGQMLLFKARPGELKSILFKNGIYLIPRKDGHVLAGSTLEYAGFDKSTTEEIKNMLYERAVDIFPEIKNASLVAQWSGLRPGSPKNIPTISRHPGIGNLYINSGHFRYGVTMAPSSASLIASLILDTAPPFDPSPYAWPAIAD